MEKIVVIVEDVDAARIALNWALHNLLRYGDVVTLLHVYPSAKSRNKNKLRRLRLKGFQLALSFRDICSASFPNAKTEIVVTEGDRDGGRIASVVREIGASTLVLGLHDRSFIYRLVIHESNITSYLRCKVLAVKEPTEPSSSSSSSSRTTSIQGSSSTTNTAFSQIEIGCLSFPDVPRQKVPYQLCPDPNAIIWRSRPSSKRWRN